MKREKVVEKINQLERLREVLIEEIHSTEDLELAFQRIEKDQDLKKQIRLWQDILSCFAEEEPCDIGNELLAIATETFTGETEVEARFNLNKLENFIRKYADKKNSN